MARRHSRKSHRRSKRISRKSHRRSTRRRQHGGSCAAMPLNRANFQQQGGMAPIAAGDDYLLDAGARATAGVGSLDASFAELPSVVPRQAGGRRRRSHKHRRPAHRRRSHRRQHGGALADFAAPSMLGPDMAKSGSNPQFLNEGAVNPLYGIKGPQA